MPHIEPGTALVIAIIVIVIAMAGGNRPPSRGASRTKAKPTTEQLLTESLKHVPPTSPIAAKLRGAIEDERARKMAERAKAGQARATGRRPAPGEIPGPFELG